MKRKTLVRNVFENIKDILCQNHNPLGGLFLKKSEYKGQNHSIILFSTCKKDVAKAALASVNQVNEAHDRIVHKLITI